MGSRYKRITISYRIKTFFDHLGLITLSLLLLFVIPTPGNSAEILIVGDMQLKPVTEIVSSIRASIKTSIAAYSTSQVAGNLQNTVIKERAKVVIALGKEAIDEALRLPPPTAVIFDMVILPLKISRPNTTGLYMATPVSEYLSVIRKYIPSLKTISIISSPFMQKSLGLEKTSQVSVHKANTSFELVQAVQQLRDTGALLLLPDVSLLTSSAMEKIYLYSFRKNVPILGVSEKHVKQGALFALVFDAASVGKQLTKLAAEALKGTDLGTIPVSPVKKFDLYVNSDTAAKMNIHLPDEMLRQAKKVYSQ